MSRILITGTSSGIGLATALELARHGHTVCAAMRNPARAPELATTAARERLPLTVHTLDVDSDTSVSEAIAALLAGAPIDALVNNAGIERSGAIEDLSMEDFRACMETNYFGALRCIRAVIPAMRQARRGCIVNISSVAGRIASTPLSPYSASKWALEAVSEALAQELRPFDVRVALVEPGIIDTPMAHRIEVPPAPSLYRHGARFAAIFREALTQPTPPTLVAEKIREIIESGDTTLRHPVGPDAAGYITWRASLTDEQWIEWNAVDDETWRSRPNRPRGPTSTSP
jgi:NAD(P)-dependent dehydrogenase (short-subunit alcohol dehydrogenase family)